MHEDRQHNALSALEILFMAARAGIGFFARDDAQGDRAKMFRVTIEKKDNGVRETRTFMAIDAAGARALAMKASNVASVVSVAPASGRADAAGRNGQPYGPWLVHFTNFKTGKREKLVVTATGKDDAMAAVNRATNGNGGQWGTIRPATTSDGPRNDSADDVFFLMMDNQMYDEYATKAAAQRDLDALRIKNPRSRFSIVTPPR